MDTLSAIISHGLSIRQIPLRITETRSFYSYKDCALPENHEIIEMQLDSKFLNYHKRHNLNSPDFRFDGDKVFRRFVRFYTVPKYAGFWMCKQVNNSTSARVEWSSKTDNLAPTLEKSVKKFLSAKNNS